MNQQDKRALVSSCEDVRKLLQGSIGWMNWMYTNGCEDDDPSWETRFVLFDNSARNELLRFTASHSSVDHNAQVAFEVIRRFPETYLFAKGPGLDTELIRVLSGS